MTPRTRSGGAAPPSSIVYKTTPTLKQVQFPARRRRIRTYGKRNRRSGGGGGGDDDDKENEEGNSTRPTPNLKQKTLTQYDFASSFNEDSVVELSDASDAENLDKGKQKDEGEKENNVPKGTKRRRSPTAKHAPLQPIDVTEQEGEEEELIVLDTEAEEEEVEEEDEGPVVRGRRAVGFADAGKTKRRRTLGEEHRRITMNESRSSRRRTLGDSPVAGPSRSRYHTQTLTQFIGRTTSCVADSDDEALGGTEDDGFLEWLGEEEEEQQGPQSPTVGTQASKRAAASAATAPASPQVWEDHSPSPRARRSNTQKPATQRMSQTPPREESVVPQTPVRSIRFGLPPSAQPNLASPSPTRLAALYGAISQYTSPSQRQRHNSKSPAAAKPLLELMGKPRRRISPAKKQQPELVIADSYATEGWSSVGGTQAPHGASPSHTQKTDVFSTPAEESAPPPPAAVVATASTQADKLPEKAEDSAAAAALLETQSQDGQVEEQFYGALSQVVQDSIAASQQPPPSPATPKQAARRSPSPVKDIPAAVSTVDAAEEREIPDSDDEEEDFGAESDDAAGGSSDEAEESRFAAGAETQLLMDQLQSSVRKWSRVPRAAGHHASSSSVASPHPPRTSSPAPAPSPGSAVTPQSAPPSSSSLRPTTTTTTTKPPPPAQPGTVANDIPLAPLPSPTPLRTPLHHPDPLDTQGVPFESQRVAVATLQNFPPASARTDILLPVSAGTLAPLLAGRQDVLVLPFKVPAQVARFWLLGDGGVLRYLACVDGHAHEPERDNGRGGRGTWSYRAAQVYELNNPAREDDMRAEDWIHGPVTRYVYFPPAVVSQLLWNLRHPLFAEPDDDDNDDVAVVTTPAAVVALSSSSPLRRSARLSTPARQRGSLPPPPSSPSPLRRAHQRPPPSTMPAPARPPRAGAAARKHHTQQPFVRPSQATTVSQASTVAPPSQAAANATMARSADDESSESLVFDDHGGSSIPMPYSGVSGLDHLAASQLLTGSQILPESLVRDEEEQERVPEEIFDSEEE